jgi:hypothetical protein
VLGPLFAFWVIAGSWLPRLFDDYATETSGILAFCLTGVALVLGVAVPAMIRGLSAKVFTSFDLLRMPSIRTLFLARWLAAAPWLCFAGACLGAAAFYRVSTLSWLAGDRNLLTAVTLFSIPTAIFAIAVGHPGSDRAIVRFASQLAIAVFCCWLALVFIVLTIGWAIPWRLFGIAVMALLIVWQTVGRLTMLDQDLADVKSSSKESASASTKSQPVPVDLPTTHSGYRSLFRIDALLWLARFRTGFSRDTNFLGSRTLARVGPAARLGSGFLFNLAGGMALPAFDQAFRESMDLSPISLIILLVWALKVIRPPSEAISVQWWMMGIDWRDQVLYFLHCGLLYAFVPRALSVTTALVVFGWSSTALALACLFLGWALYELTRTPRLEVEGLLDSGWLLIALLAASIYFHFDHPGLFAIVGAVVAGMAVLRMRAVLSLGGVPADGEGIAAT